MLLSGNQVFKRMSLWLGITSHSNHNRPMWVCVGGIQNVPYYFEMLRQLLPVIIVLLCYRALEIMTWKPTHGGWSYEEHDTYFGWSAWRDSWFWLLALEVSVPDGLVLFLLGMWQGRASYQGACGRTKLVLTSKGWGMMGSRERRLVMVFLLDSCWLYSMSDRKTAGLAMGKSWWTQ